MTSPVPGIAPARRRPLLRIGVPAAVVLALAAVVLVAAREVLRPVVPVPVHAVVFDPSAPDAALVTLESEGDAGAVAPGGAGRFVAPRRGVGASVQAPGWLEADPYLFAVSALADGVVEEMLVLEGESVEAGQVVARLVADDAELALVAAEAAVADAAAAREMARADAVAAETDWREPVALERELGVSRGRLAEFEAQLVQLPAKIATERATEERLVEELARVREAQTGGAATDFEVVILEKDLEAQRQRVRTLELSEAIIRGHVAEQVASVRAAQRALELRVDDRRARDLAVAAFASAEAMVRRAEVARDEAALRLDRMTIVSPIDGFVQRRLKGPGDKVMLAMDGPHTAHLVHVYDPEKIQVRVDIPLADAAHVFVGQDCDVVVEVLPGTTFRGRVTRITHEADLQKNTLQAKVAVLDPSPLLRPEMLTRVKFLPGTPEASRSSDAAAPADGPGDAAPAAMAAATGAALRLPRAAFAAEPRDGDAAIVWVVSERRGLRGLLRAVTVTVAGGPTADGLLPIEGPLRPGDLVAAADVPQAAGYAEGTRVRMLTGALDGGAS